MSDIEARLRKIEEVIWASSHVLCGVRDIMKDDDNCTEHIITDDQIDKAWCLVYDFNRMVADGAARALSQIGVGPCDKCGGESMTDHPTKPEACIRCNGRGWIKVSADVDKCGQFGTEDD